MKILIAIDSFKGSCTALQAACSIEKGLRSVFPAAEIIKMPVADGGEGTVEALLASAGGQLYERQVTGPLGSRILASFGILSNGTAIIETASASGLPLVPPSQRNPMLTTTFGTGELILEAAKLGCKRILLGLGGSATNDGGIGAASALGILFCDAEGNTVGYGGGVLKDIVSIDSSGLYPFLKDIEIHIACDVTNPLFGPNGAACVFAPQKGADEQMVKHLDSGLRQYAHVIKNTTGFDCESFPGGGAAGGLAVPLVAFCGAKLQSGIELVLNAVEFDAKLKGADIVITGEGMLDFQTVFGKVPVGVASHAKKYGIPVIAIVGAMGQDYQSVYSHGIDSVFNIQNAPMSLEYAMKNAEPLLDDCAQRIARLLAIKWKG